MAIIRHVPPGPECDVCPTPTFSDGLGLGTEWQCDKCGAVWRLAAPHTSSRSAAWSRVSGPGQPRPDGTPFSPSRPIGGDGRLVLNVVGFVVGALVMAAVLAALV